MMIASVRRTWAPLGQTPIVRHHDRRDRISVIGGLSVSPKRRRLGVYFRMHPKNISQEEVYDLLGYLMRHLRGHVIVVWDGASIHDPKSLSELLRKYPRLHLQRLPAYAPQLNPIEAAWHATKVLAGMRNRVILGVRGGFLNERQEPAVTSALWAHDRSQTPRQ